MINNRSNIISPFGGDFLKAYKKIISLFCVFATVFSLAVSVSAVDSSVAGGTSSDFWSMALHCASDEFEGLAGLAFKALGGLVSQDSTCVVSDDHLHHGDVTGAGASRGGVHTLVCVCDYCGKTFSVDKTSDDLDTAYNTYVSNLQTDLGSTTLIDGGVRAYFDYPVDKVTYNRLDAVSCVGGVRPGGTFLTKGYTSDSWVKIGWRYAGVIVVKAPFAASYSYGYDFDLNCAAVFQADKKTDVTYTCTAGTTISAPYFILSADNLSSGTTINYTVSGWVDLFPVSGASLPTSQNITINSRPTSITGDYGILGDNGTITKVDGNVIVDESASTVYNPVTNTTTNFTSWSYDYSDRSYNLTTEAGDTITVTYGDENITINEGDTIYNVYYVIPSEPDTPSDPGTAHTHTYSSSVTTAPTCAAPGVNTFTCSECGNSYTQRIPATGHTWTVKQSVPTEYDESGNLVMQGYTIYQCSVCGEEYKDESGSGPPSSKPQEEEVTEEGFFGWLWGILKKLIGSVVNGIVKIFDFFFGGDGVSDNDFYNSPSTFSGVSVWA